MENKHGSGKAGSLGGKGFYIVLFLCAAVIGMSAWLMLTDVGTNVEDTAETQEEAVDVSGAFVTMLPAGQAGSQAGVPEEAAAPEEEPVETAGEPETQEPAEEETSDQQPPPAQEVFDETVTSYIWPVEGSVQVPYSVETLLYDSTMADWRTHDGVDIACEPGTPVMAAAGGKVVSVRSDDLLGTVVEVDHANGTHSIYANLAAEPPVSQGAVVAMGQILGSVGGTALGEVNQVSHLHFAMTRDGAAADPMNYLPPDGMG